MNPRLHPRPTGGVMINDESPPRLYFELLEIKPINENEQ
jgi:hypothetical protein